MDDIRRNRELFSKLWKNTKVKSHTFWVAWEKFKEVIPKDNPMRLEIGCGVRPRIPVPGSHFLDLVESALNTLGSYGGICLYGDAAFLPYRSKIFDFVNASDLLEHVKDDEKVFWEVARVLKPEGYFSFSVPLQMKYWTRFDEKMNHLRRYEPEELIKKMRKSGFRIDSFYLNKPVKSKMIKSLILIVLFHAPRFGFFLDERIFSPITEKIKKTFKRNWHTDGFKERTKNASGVIVICQKTAGQ